MGIGVVSVSMLVRMIMAVLMPSTQRDRDAVGLTRTCALVFAELTSIGEALNVVVVTFLCQANLSLEAKNLSPVLAERAIHGRLATQHFLHPFHKGVEHKRVISEITS